MYRKSSVANNSGVVAWFLNNSVAANLLMLVILVLGALAFSNIRLESFPQIPAKYIVITVPFEGGTPEEVEAGVTIKIEKAIDGTPGIKSISSNSYSDKSTVEVEVKTGYDLAVVMRRIAGKIEALENMPKQALTPVIAQEVEESNVVWINIRGDVSEHTLKGIATDLKRELLLSQNITKVSHYGLRNSEISIHFDQEKLAQHRISFSEVAESLRKSSLDLGIGSIKTNTGHILLRINEEKRSAYEFGNLMVRSDEFGNTLYLRDIAEVVDGFERDDLVSMFNGVPSIMLEVKTEGDTDVLKAFAEVKLLVEQYQQSVPDIISVVLWNNMTREVSDRLTFFAQGGLMAMLMVGIMLAIFLDVKLAFWVAVGIPVSFAGAITLMNSPIFGFSLNAVTLFAFILVLGIVVDDAIIIGESIFQAKQSTDDSFDATLEGVNSVSIPATFGVLTTVAAFWPLTNLVSELGIMLGQLAWVVIFCLLFSLIESKLILPVHLRNLQLKPKRRSKGLGVIWQRFQVRIGGCFTQLTNRIYLPFLSRVLKYRYLACMFFVSLLFLAMTMTSSGLVRSLFFPEMDQEYLQASFELSPYVNQFEAENIARSMTESIRAVSDKLLEDGQQDPVKGVYSLIKGKQLIVIAELAEMTQRNISGNDLSKLWREKAGYVAGVEISRFQIRDSDIEIELYSDDLDLLNQASAALANKLRTYGVVTDVYRNVNVVREKIQLSLTDLGRSRGITEALLSAQVRNAFYGLEVQRIQLDEEVNVILRYRDEKRASIADLLSMRIVDLQGNEFMLGSLVELEIVPGLDQISRIGGQRVIIVNASVDKSHVSPDTLVELLEEQYLQTFTSLYPGVSIGVSGDVEDDDLAQDSLIRAFWVSLLLIYILLAIPLKSYVKPLVIMAVIPFGLIGAVVGHFIIGIPFSILSFFGLLALSGVVVNDSLILVSTISQSRQKGLDMNESISTACGRRFRSVVLTSCTTFVGLIPFIFDTSYQAQFLIPTAVSLGFGIVFSTLIILFAVPSLYYVAYDVKVYLGRIGLIGLVDEPGEVTRSL